MKRMLLTLLAALGLIVPTLRAQDVWDGTTIDTSWYDSATADTTTSYEISTAAQLAGVAKLVNDGITTFEGKTITLKANVNLAGEEWTPIGMNNNKAFRGTFDGDGKTISNLTITVKNNNVGLFGYLLSPATIKGVTLKHVSISGNLCVGCIAGYAYTGTEIVDCHILGKIAVEGWWYIGGIAGNGYLDKVDNCTVVGEGDSFIKSLTGSYIGGIWGFRAEGKLFITNCRVENVAISAVDRVGGIAGIVHYGNTISQCTVRNVTILATLVDADPARSTCGLIAGANLGLTGQAPSKVLDCTVEATTAKEDSTAVTRWVGANDNKNTPCTNTIVGTNVIFDDKGKVTGGTFEALTENNLAEGMGMSDTPDGILVFKAIAAIGDTTYATLQAAIDAAQPGDTVTVLMDVDLTDLPGGYNVFDISGVVLDLNQKTITAGNPGANKGYAVFQGVNATIRNGKFTVTAGNYALFIGDEGETDGFVVEDVVTSGINIFNATNVTLRRVTSAGKAYYSVWCDENGHVTIESGEYSSEGKAVLGLWASATMAVMDGSFTAKDDQPMVLEGAFGKPVVNGGTFNKDMRAEHATLGESLTWKENDDGTYTTEVLNETNAVAKIVRDERGIYYATLQAAIDAAQTGDTVTLLTDVVFDDFDAVYSAWATEWGEKYETEPEAAKAALVSALNNRLLTLDRDVTITLDLAGHTISSDVGYLPETLLNDPYPCGTLMLKQGNLTLKDSSTTGTGEIRGASMAVFQRGGTLTVQGGTYCPVGGKSEWVDPMYPIAALWTADGMCTIEGGTFHAGSACVSAETIPDLSPDSAVPSVTIKGGRFKGFPVGRVTVAAQVLASDKEGMFVAYRTFADFAQAHAETFDYDGETSLLRLKADYLPKGGFFVNGDVTIDLNGHKWTFPQDGQLFCNSGTVVTLQDSAGTGCLSQEAPSQESVIVTRGAFTLSSGTIGTADTATHGIIVAGNAALTINGGTIYGVFSAIAEASNNDGKCTITINGGTQIVQQWAGCPFLPDQSGAPSTVTCTVTGGSYELKESPDEDRKKLKANLSKYCAADYVVLKNADGTYDVVQGEWAAEVADEKYATLQEAVEAAEAATSDPLPTITLLRDVVLEDTVTLTKNLSIDLAGHTLYAPNPSTPAFTADSSVTVTLSKKEDGTVNGRLIAAGQKPEHNVTIDGVLSITKWTEVYDLSWYNFTQAPAEKYILTTPEQLGGLAILLSEAVYDLPGVDGSAEFDFSKTTFELGADIDLAGLEWVPPEYLDGTFDGMTHTIKNLYTKEAAGYVGFFGEVAPGAVVQNLIVESATFEAKPARIDRKQVLYLGAIAGVMDGTVRRCVARNCSLTAVPSGTTLPDTHALGGLVGTVSGGERIVDCSVEGGSFQPETATFGTFAGKAVNDTEFIRCYVDGALTQTTGTLMNVYAKNGDTFVRHNTVADPNAPSGELGEAAALNGIGWLLNGQKTEGALTWHVDSNENCKTLLPFATATVATIPEVELLATRVTDGTKEWVYANGSPIIIQEDEAEGSTLVTLWREDYRVDERYPFTAEQAGELRVVGGALKRTVASASITMKGGTVKTIYGGGRGASDAPAHVENTVTLLIEGGTVGNAVYGGGNHYAHVGRVETVIGKEGKPGPTVTNYVAGGANGGELGEADTRVDEASVRLLSGNIGKLFGGGQGYTFVGISTIEMAGGTVKELIGGGSNGTTQEVAIAVSGGTVMDALFAANRGTVGAVTMALSTALNPKYGICLSNCLESNDTDGVVSGTVTLTNNAVGQSPIYFGATLGEATGVSIGGDQPISVVAQASATKGGEVSVPSAQTLFLGGNVTLTVPTDATFTVDGEVTLAEGAKLVGASATSVLKNTGKIVGMEAGVSTWDTQDKKWLMSLVRMGDYYYASVAVALAKNPTAGTVVELLSSTAATDEVKCRTKGGTVTVNQGVNAYDVAELLGGAFKVSEDAQSLVYDYDLGVGGLTIRRATANEATEEIKEGDLVVEVTVKLTEGDAAPSRTLADCTLTVTSTLDGEAKTFPLVGTLTFTNGECKVTIPYTEENFPMGTNRLTVSISKGVGEGTP